jgi:hypothetical protein
MEGTSEETKRVFPRSSAFEALLAKVYLELWELQDNPPAFTSRVRNFVEFFLPTMFQEKVAGKFPDLNTAIEATERRVNALQALKSKVDSLDGDDINRLAIPLEEVELAKRIWHHTVDVLTEAGFNFPISKTTPRRLMRA